MIYFLFGQNSYQAIRKIREFKLAFLEKHHDELIEEFYGENGVVLENPRDIFGQQSLFSKTRLVIFRNVLESDEKFFKTLKECAAFLRSSRDVFVFWEKEPEKPALAFFKKYAEKIQEVKPLSKTELGIWLDKKSKALDLTLTKEDKETMIEEAGSDASVGVDGSVQWALENELEKRALNGQASSKSDFKSQKKSDFFPAGAVSPFGFVEKIFSAPFGRALLALKEAEVAGHEPQKFIYPLLWKAKQKKMPDAYLAGIFAESAMRKDPKNSYEILERFILEIQV